MHLIEVRFKGNRKEFFHWAGDDPPALRAPVIVDADRGEDLGVVHSVGDAALHRFAGLAHGQAAGPVTRRALRLATAAEYEDEHRLRHEDDEAARRQSMERVRAHGLTMKVTDAEWQWDRRKLTLYFTAERRVDFRALVRDLASAFRARIELKQIGVRDEARRLDGIGRCGRQYCSASWLPELRPVNLGVAKDQGLSLNPLQISGACGRLMCCLRYEHEFYVQSRKRFPKEGRVLVTARGEEKVVANDIFNDRVTLRNAEGDVRVAELAELRAEIAARADGGAISPGGSGEGRTELPHAADAHSGADAGNADAEDDARGSRAPRPRRALPVREQSAQRRSTRPATRTAAVDGASGTTGEQAPPASGEAAAATRGVVAADADPRARAAARADEEPRGSMAGVEDEDAGLEGRDGAVAGDAGPDDAEDGATADDTRRRRRRGRRGGRRGRTGRSDEGRAGAEQANDSGADPRPDADDQGE